MFKTIPATNPSFFSVVYGQSSIEMVKAIPAVLEKDVKLILEDYNSGKTIDPYECIGDVILLRNTHLLQEALKMASDMSELCLLCKLP